MRVRVVSRRRLNGTLDGHDPLVCTFAITGPRGAFKLTVVTCNLGRGYTPQQFRANVARLLEAVADHEYVVLLLQEIDEADPSPEHQIIRAAIRDTFGQAAQYVQWATREPIVVIGNGIKVTHSRKTMTMDQGTNIGAPAGTGPRRYLVSCIAEVEGVRIGLGNQHPHRYSLTGRAVTAARRRGERVTRRVIGALARVCDVVIDGGDLNTTRYPLLTKLGQRNAMHVGLDYIRIIISRRS